MARQTLKEAAIEFSRRRHGDEPEWEVDRVESATSFSAGVEWAEQWISVEDELPLVSYGSVLIRGISPYTGKYFVRVGHIEEPATSADNIWPDIGSAFKVTHWRLIEHN